MSPKITSPWFSLHTHTNHSVIDGMSPAEIMVKKAARMGQPAIGFLDHGNMSATVKGYKAAQEAGIKFFPGFEGYLIDPVVDDWENPPKGTKVGRYHFGIQALNEDGYKALVKLSSLSHTRPRFNRFSRLTMGDLAEFGMEHGEDVAFYTGCYFGYVQQTLVKDLHGNGPANAERIVRQFSQWFPNLFVELQHHNIDHVDDEGRYQGNDDDIVEALFKIAMDNGLPVVAGQDSHYCDQRQKGAHALMKRMVYAGGDDEFPGDSFHLATSDWVQEHYRPEVWAEVEKGHQRLLDLHDLRITPLDTFTPDVPRISKAPSKKIRRMCTAKLEEYLEAQSIGKGKRAQRYLDELSEELRVIDHLGMAEYFVIVRDYVEWCHDNDVFVEARGSANGSLVCFLLGITQIDPVKHGTDFARFLSVDRIKPPDIDMDVEDARRPDLMHYLLSKYDSVQIGTFGKLGASYSEREDREGGSVLQSWISYKRRVCFDEAKTILTTRAERKGDKAPTQVEIKAYGSAIFRNNYGDVEDVRDVEDLEPKDYAGLREMIKMDSVYRSYGVHAGGVLLSGEHVKIADYIPTMLVASSETRVSQYDMDDVEEFGLLKMDILGQATLRTMKLANEMIVGEGQDPADLTWIPDDDRATLRDMRSGRTKTGVFHVEGFTKARGARSLPIKSTKDCVLWQALYMPGAMDTGQTDHVERARKDPEFRQEVTYIHPVFERWLKETYGAYVYQNQVMNILRDLGMDIPSINVFLKVVKASGKGAEEKNRAKLEGLAATYHDLCVTHGISEADERESWEALCGFGAYGFNKNHAAGYGIRSYRCQYLKTHHPLEFMTALLQTWSGRDKEKDYIKEARRVELRILPPHVNISTDTWVMDTKRNGIRRGLSSVPGIGEKSALAIAESAPFTSIEDMVARVPGRALTGGKKYLESEGKEPTGIIAKLDDAGALKDLPLTGTPTLFDDED